MPRQVVPAEVNSFVKGLITEASPLTFPDNASLEEVNFVLNKDGSRQRRLGMDIKDGFADLVASADTSGDVVVQAYRWENVGGVADLAVIALQVGTTLYLMDSSNLDGSYVASFNDVSADASTPLSVTSVDGRLVFVGGKKPVSSISYSDGTYTLTTGILKIRDLFGVEDIVSSVDLLSSEYLEYRPSSTTSEHTYNLRNQTFAIPRYIGNAETTTDAISGFVSASGGKFPSNADSVTPFFFSDANDSDNRNVERYFASEAVKNPLGSFRAPLGYFIIDALERGSSRVSNIVRLKERYPANSYGVSSLKQDRTPGGATVVAQFAGRVFYGGFSGEIVDGDSRSPRMASYVLFSKTVDSTSDITLCYQVGDPTSKESPDIVATDGGFIRLDGAYGISRMVNVGSQLVVLARNGVWSISGGNDYGFSAENYLVKRLSDRGCYAPNSAVVVDNSITFWGLDGIYTVGANQFGDFEVKNISNDTIQKFFDNIAVDDKAACVGMYDSYERKVRWLYQTNFKIAETTKELILDITTGAFSLNEIYLGSVGYKVVSPAETSIYTVGSTEEQITVGGVQVTVGGVGVVLIDLQVEQQTKELSYILVKGYTSNTVTISMSTYSNTDFMDWGNVDAPAYLLTGWMGGGDFQRKKKVPYLTMYMKRTETSIDENYELVGQSSCKVQSMSEWTDSINSGRWGREFEAYRLGRPFYGQVGQEYEDGYPVVVTKNKLRGTGRVLSLKISTSPGKDLKLYGWSMLIDVAGNV